MILYGISFSVFVLKRTEKEKLYMHDVLFGDKVYGYKNNNTEIFATERFVEDNQSLTPNTRYQYRCIYT